MTLPMDVLRQYHPELYDELLEFQDKIGFSFRGAYRRKAHPHFLVEDTLIFACALSAGELPWVVNWRLHCDLAAERVSETVIQTLHELSLGATRLAKNLKGIERTARSIFDLSESGHMTRLASLRGNEVWTSWRANMSPAPTHQVGASRVMSTENVQGWPANLETWSCQAFMRKTQVDLERPVVYYIRQGDFIKIGSAVNLPARMFHLGASEIMAAEVCNDKCNHFLAPETDSKKRILEHEKMRHQKFDKYRVTVHEFFYPGPDLIRHIEEIGK